MTDLDAFNALPEAEARERLAECLDVPRWVDTVLEGRPYADRGRAAEGRRGGRGHDDRRGAGVRAGPPPADRRTRRRRSRRGALAREQAGVDPADRDVARRLAAGNLAYEERFDRVFLIRAAGRSGPQILAELDRRLGNDDATERAETVTQLREIALLRLEQVL